MHGGAYIRVEKRVTNLGGLYSGELIHGGGLFTEFYGILATKQEFFFTKVAPVQSITDTVLLLLIPGMFISYYTIIYFFVNNFFFEYFFQ